MKEKIMGLSDDEVLLREKQGRINVTTEKITKPTAQIFKDNIFTLFNAFNLGLGISLAIVGAWTNMAFLFIIFANISIGIIQEIRAKKLVENLSLISAPKATVVRGGTQCELPVEKLVIDDIVILEAGNQICADSVVINGEIEVNESLLTGESDSVLKRGGDNLLSGSFVVSGKCYARTERVGAENFAVKLAHEAKKHKKINSNLLRSMNKVTKFTGFFIAPIGILMFAEAYFLRSSSIYDSVVFTAAALLGMLPKGLILIITIALATGVIKLSKKRVLVQQMHCIETLAHTDIMCLDKTGTITEGKMRVSEFRIIDADAMPIPSEKAIKCFIGATDCNNATFNVIKEYFKTDDTLNPILKTPFSSERKWSSVTFENFGTVVLGAPEKLGAKDVFNEDKRILCFGYTKDAVHGDLLPEIKIFAVIGLDDPIRKNAKETLDFFKREGVEIKIISGDNPITVSGIAKKAGLENYGSYVDMSEFKGDDISAAAEKYSIFGRVGPQQKQQLVKALQANGHTVAMTGDGVNDAPALREADCGIAMAAGSEAAKQASHLVLLDSDFAALPEVVMEGRRVIHNLTRIASFFFIKTIFSVLLSVFAVLSNTPFPFIPVQITIFDAVLEAYPGFFLSFEPCRRRMKGTFLRRSIRNAVPFALLISINFLVISFLGFEKSTATVWMYYITGFAGLSALIKSCRPFNKLRAFLCFSAGIGFYAAAYFLKDFLNLSALSFMSLIWFIIFAVLCIPVLFLFDYIVRRIKVFG